MSTNKQLANLKPPFRKGEQREEQRKGGITSGKVRRFKKTFRELLQNELSKTDTHGVTKKEKIVREWLKIIKTGNESTQLKAIEMIRDTIGEKPTEVIEHKTPPVVNDLSKLDGKTLMGLAKEAAVTITSDDE